MFESVKMLLRRKFLRISPPRQGREKSAEQYGQALYEQRDFQRYLVSFPVAVSGKDPRHHTSFEEKTRLQNVSGGGAMFLTEDPGRYYAGQVLGISILLDAAEDVQARITNEATVVRTGAPPDGHTASSRDFGVAVEFHRSFEFERIDPGRSGYSG